MAYGRRKRMHRKYNNSSVAQKALSLAKKNARKCELKMHNTDILETAVNYSTGVLYPLDKLGRGTTNNTRVGNVLTPTSVVLRPNWPVIIGSGSHSYRMILFQWKNGTPAPFNGTSVLEAAQMAAFKNETLRYASKILWDRTFYYENADVTKYPTFIKKKLSGIISYEAVTDDLTNKNGLYLLVLANTTALIPMDIQARLYYKDD